MPIQLKKHNQKTYEKIEEKFNDSNRVAVIHPTGTGKSYLALKLLENNKGKKALYVAPSIPILHNLKKSIFESGMDMSDFCGLKRITYSKLMKMSDEEIEKLGVDIIILDEFHHCGAPEWGKGVQRLLNRNPNSRVLGLSATPIRYLDGARDMAEEIFGGNVASEMTLEEAIEEGILPQATYVSALYSYNETIEKMQQNINSISDLNRKRSAQELFELLKEKLNGNTKQLPEILSQHMEKQNGKYIVFCKNIDDMKKKMEEAQEIFGRVNSNISIYSVSSVNDIKKNDKTLSEFEKADDDSLKLMFAVNMLNEGYHVNDLDGVIMMRPTFSPTIFTQQLGRALSVKKEDGKPPVIIDLVDNFDSCKIIEDFCERMKQYKGKGSNNPNSNKQKKNKLSIFDKTREFREIANKITELSKRKNMSLDEKVELIIQCAETGEEITGQTIYQGYPVGQWMILIRSQINQGKDINISNEHMKKLKEIGLMERKFDSTIDEKIQELIEWNKQYPFLQMSKNSKQHLRKYCKSEEEYQELLNKYEKMQKYYGYVRNRKSQGMLTNEQEKMCTEGNIRGVFGYPESTKLLSRKYGLNLEKIDYICSKYGTMEEFIRVLRDGKLDYEDENLLKDNLNFIIDINKDKDINKILFVKCLVEQMWIRNLESPKIKMFDGSKIEELIDKLGENRTQYAQSIRLNMGFYDGKTYKFSEISKMLKVTPERIRQRILKGFRLLESIEKRKAIIFQAGESEQCRYEKNLTPEQINKIETLLDRIYSSNLIFIPDEGVTQEPCDITSEELALIANKIKSIRDGRDSVYEENKEIFVRNRTDIFAINWSSRAYNCLLRYGVKTVEQFRRLDPRAFRNSRNMGPKTFQEILEKIKAIIPEGEEVFIADNINEFNLPIDELAIIDETFSVLKRLNINISGELVKLSEEQLNSIEDEHDRKILIKAVEDLRKKYGIIKISTTEKFERKVTYIYELDLSVRAFNCLNRAGIKTLEQLRYQNLEDMARIRNMGTKTLKEIETKVRRLIPENESIFVEDTRSESEVPIDELDISDKLFVILKKVAINTVAEFRSVSIEQFEHIKGIDEEHLLAEVRSELKKLEEKYGSNMTELERLKKLKAKKTDEAEELRKKIQEASELLESYDKLANENVQVNNRNE